METTTPEPDPHPKQDIEEIEKRWNAENIAFTCSISILKPTTQTNLETFRRLIGSNDFLSHPFVWHIDSSYPEVLENITLIVTQPH